jgi:glycosyltransferase involved in cell wall biosynthesis
MKVSIVTVCFNAADTIEHTIRSVLDQRYEHIEHVIVDGGSTDGTLDIVKRFNGRIKKFISEPDGGIYDAMNKGLHLAQGEVVAFLNADDVYASPTVISDVVAAMHADHTEGVYGDLVYVGRKNHNRIVRYWRAGEYWPKAFHSGWVPPHPTFFCRTALYRELGGYNPACQIAGDFELMLRFIEKHRIRVQYVPKPFVYMRAGGRGNTLRGIIQGNREIIQAFRRNGMAFPPGFFFAKFLRKARQFVKKPSMNLVP